MRPPAWSLPVRYGLALLSSAVALDLTLLLADVLTPTVGQLFFLAIVLSAWYGGLGPGLLAAACAVLAVDFLFVPPLYAFVPGPSTLIRLAVYGGVAVTIVFLNSRRGRVAAQREELLQAVDEQRRLFQAVVEHAPVGIAVLRGPDLVFELVNRVYQAIAPGKSMLGRPVAEVWPEVVLHFMPLLQHVLRTGEPFQATDMPLRIQRAPGGPLEDAHFTFAYVRLSLPPRRPYSVLVLVAESTDQVRARQRIEELAEVARRQASELEAVIESMVDAVLVADAQGVLVRVNRAGLELLGLKSMEEAIRPLAEYAQLATFRSLDGRIIPPDEYGLSKALRGETFAGHLMRIETSDGRVRWTSDSGAPVRDEQGNIILAVSVTRDITELTDLDRLKDQFIAVAAHELKTPVTVMKGYAQALLRKAAEVSPERRKMLEAIDLGANRIDRVVGDLLDISRLQLGHLELTLEKLDLAQLVEQVADRMALTTTRHRIRLTSTEPVMVRGDRDRLEQVVFNLLDNAIRYSPKGGDVEVAVVVQKHEAVVSVRDTGVGIAPDKQARLFQRFYRAHTGTPHDYGGMGVGLYISREIVSRHGGRTWFESEEGQGSCFAFSLPVRGAADGG